MSKNTFFLIPGILDSFFDVVIEQCCQSQITHWKFHNSIFPCWVFYWNQDPGAFLVVNSRKIYLHPEKVYLLPPYTPHDSDMDAPFRHFYIHFKAPAPFDQVKRQILSFSASKLRIFFEAIEKKPPQYKVSLLLRIMLYQYLLQVPQSYFLKPGESLLSPAIQQVMERMNSDVHYLPDNRELSRKAGIPLNLFYQEFSRVVGMSPRQYWKNQRMEAARRLLLQNSITIEEIADKTGYADRFHFSKAFRQFYGISPAAYRRNNTTKLSKRIE